MKRNRRGYTLIELMVAISIIGVICGLASSAYASSKDHANARLCAREQRVLTGALEAWRFDHPGEVAEFDQAMAQALIDDGFLKYSPHCPGHYRDGIAAFHLVGCQVVCRHHGGDSAKKP
jgi:prepilin-type N-terminal cleavage/methylation domain-containing protein